MCLSMQSTKDINWRSQKTSVLFCIDWWPESTQGNKWLTHMVMFTQSSKREIQQKVCDGE